MVTSYLSRRLCFAAQLIIPPDVGTVPLLTMAKAALKYYQLSADYYQSLHHTAHPQPWINGLEGDEDISVTGVMAVWSLPGDSQCGYLEISGSGIELTKKEMDAQKMLLLKLVPR